jgi:small-conductance mechanosensitive channel
MKRTVIKYGLFGLLTGVVIFLASILLGKGLSYSVQEILGYVSMAACLSFVFFGIKHYRDKVNNGVVSLGKAITIGLLISILVGIGVGIADYIYTTVINPNFASEYLETSLNNLEKTLTPQDFELKKAELTQQMTNYGGSGFMAFLMFFTVVIIGFVISLISGLILQRK